MAVGQKVNSAEELNALPHATVVVFYHGEKTPNPFGGEAAAAWPVQVINLDGRPVIFTVGDGNAVPPESIFNWPGEVVFEVTE